MKLFMRNISPAYSRSFRATCLLCRGLATARAPEVPNEWEQFDEKSSVQSKLDDETIYDDAYSNTAAFYQDGAIYDPARDDLDNLAKAEEGLLAPRQPPRFGSGSNAQSLRGSQLLRLGNFVKTFRAGTFVTPASLDPNNVGVPREGLLTNIRGPSRRIWRRSDPLLALGFHPHRETGNTGLFSPFLSKTGRILGRSESGLSRPMQKSMALAVRRARPFGVSPYFSDKGAPNHSWDRARYNRILGGPGYRHVVT